MIKSFEYKAVARLDLRNPKKRLLNKLNTFCFFAIMVGCVIGILLNYILRMPGYAGGMYFVYILCGFVLCLIYPYVHEYAHALAVISVTGKRPYVKFGKFAAYCGSPDVVFCKSKYFFVASFPFFLFCAILIPLCILLPAEYFVLPFMPLVYNVFGSAADLFMIVRALRTPRRSLVIDSGTDVVIFVPIKKTDI